MRTFLSRSERFFFYSFNVFCFLFFIASCSLMNLFALTDPSSISESEFLTFSMFSSSSGNLTASFLRIPDVNKNKDLAFFVE